MSKQTDMVVSIYQIKVTLSDSKPPIWRRIEVPEDIRLDKLHTVLQIAMGWTDSHLHQFSLPTPREQPVIYYGMRDPDVDKSRTMDERRYRLNELINTPRQKLIYEYDFGDLWDHVLVLEKILEPDPDVRYPRCTAGKLACPLENSGGVYGYYQVLRQVKLN